MKNYFSGIDIGSTSIKIAIIDTEGNIIATSVSPTGSLFYKNTAEAYGRLLAENALSKDNILYTVSTGYGRKLFKDADENVSEITANISGARAMTRVDGQVRTIINIGGQDLKVISLDEHGHCVNFLMNDKCAAGTGRFLEVVARNLEIEVDQMGDLHNSRGGLPATINSTCTVFAESEIVSLLASGMGKGEIISGVHYSIAHRITRMVKRLGAEEVVVFDGGPAMNKGLVESMEDELMKKLFIPEHPQVTTAVGAAFLAREFHSGAVHA